MATRCFGRARLAGAGALPLLASFLRAVLLAAALRAGDFFCAVDLAAARAAGLFAFFLAIDALPCVSLGGMLAQQRLRRVGKAKRAPHPATSSRRDGGPGALRLCPPYAPSVNAAGTRRRRRAAPRA